MKNLIVILRDVYLKSLANRISAFQLADEIRAALLLYILVFFLVGMFVFFSHLFNYLNSIFIIGPFLVSRFFSAALFAVWWLAFFSGLSSVYRHIYFRKDIPLLLSLPISRKEFFTLKFLHIYKDTIITSAIILIPLLAAFGLSYNAGILFYIQSLAGLVLFYLTSSLCAVLLVVLVSSVFPAARSRRAVWFLIGFGLVVFYASARFMIEPLRVITSLSSPSGKEIMSIDQISGFLSLSMNRPVVSYFPSGLYSGILMDLLSHSDNRLFPYMRWVYLGIYTFAFFYLSILVMKRYYSLSFSIKDDSRGVNYVSKIFFELLKGKYMPGNLYYVLGEIDIKNFLRNPAQWSQLMMSLGLIVVYVISMWRALNTSYGGMTYLKIVVLLWGAFLVCVIAAALSLRFIFSDIATISPGEFRAFGYFPVNMNDVVAEKFFVRVGGITGVVGLTGVAAFCGSLLRMKNFGEVFIPYQGVLVFLMIFFSITLTLAIGSFAFSKGVVKMKREVFSNNDIESSPESSPQGLLFSVVTLVYILVNFSILAFPLRSYYFAVISFGLTKSFVVMYKLVFVVIFLSVVNLAMSYFFYKKSIYDFSKLP